MSCVRLVQVNGGKVVQGGGKRSCYGANRRGREGRRARGREAQRAPVRGPSLFFNNMQDSKMLEIQDAAVQSAKDAVKAQVAKGLPDTGISKARHLAIVAYVTVEMLASFDPETEDEKKLSLEDWQKQVLRAAYSGSLLNCSQLRQDMEKAEVLKKSSTMLVTQYEV